MASINAKNGVYHVRFRFEGIQYKKSLKTKDQRDAKAGLNIVEHTIYRLTTGQLQCPESVDLGDFIVSGGVVRPKSTAKVPSLDKLIDNYLSAQVDKAESSVATERTHLSNLRRGLGPICDRLCNRVTEADLRMYLETRLTERSPVTVNKERTTILLLFKYAKREGFIKALPTEELPRFQESGDRDGFKTIAEIEQIIVRGSLDQEQVDAIWECLYLTSSETVSLLDLVDRRALEDFAPLLHVVPAYTGIRRGELLRLRWQDVDFERDELTARSRKQSRQSRETQRRIQMHPDLKPRLLSWREERPRGQYVVCPKQSLDPLTIDEANRNFWQPLRKTSWQLPGKNRFKVGFHTYRHSFASNLAAAGVDQRVIDEFMGHTTEAMRKRYRHLFPSVRRAAIEKLVFDGKCRPEESADEKQAS